MSRVVVCGSLNMDVVVQSARRPAPGETILGAEVSFLPGGKGLNQAIACARLGVPTAMVGAVGNDAFANSLRGFLADNDVDSTSVTRSRRAGDRRGADPGRRRRQFDHRRLRRQHAFRCVACCTTNRNTTKCGWRSSRRRSPRHEEILARAREAGARTVLNLAPFTDASGRADEIGRCRRAERDRAVAGDRHRARRVAVPQESVVAACNILRERGARAVIATLGARGAVVVSATGVDAIPAFQTKVVDTTGAGDCFVGALACTPGRGPDARGSGALRQRRRLVLGREAGRRAGHADRRGSCGAAGESLNPGHGRRTLQAGRLHQGSRRYRDRCRGARRAARSLDLLSHRRRTARRHRPAALGRRRGQDRRHGEGRRRRRAARAGARCAAARGRREGPHVARLGAPPPAHAHAHRAARDVGRHQGQRHRRPGRRRQEPPRLQPRGRGAGQGMGDRGGQQADRARPAGHAAMDHRRGADVAARTGEDDERAAADGRGPRPPPVDRGRRPRRPAAARMSRRPARSAASSASRSRTRER